MGLFNLPHCPVCGSKSALFLRLKNDGEYICDTCYSKIDMEHDKVCTLTLQQYKKYLIFYRQNQRLKTKFVTSMCIDLGKRDGAIIFDYHNKLLCKSNNPDKTIFEAEQLKSFQVKKKDTLLYEGSKEYIRRYAATVQEHAKGINLSEQSSQTVHVELQFNHPYWSKIAWDMEDPALELLEQLVSAVRLVAFPFAPEQISDRIARKEYEVIEPRLIGV